MEVFGFFFSGLDVCLRVFNGGVVRLSREFGGEWFFFIMILEKEQRGWSIYR